MGANTCLIWEATPCSYGRYGHSPLIDGAREGAAVVQPGTGIVAEFSRHNARGAWLVEDQTADHAHAGSAALLRVTERLTVRCENAEWVKC